MGGQISVSPEEMEGLGSAYARASRSLEEVLQTLKPLGSSVTVALGGKVGPQSAQLFHKIDEAVATAVDHLASYQQALLTSASNYTTTDNNVAGVVPPTGPK